MARTRTAPQPSLDQLGITAAVYPSEDQLWAVGPPINDPGGQGVQGYGDSGHGDLPLIDSDGNPPTPSSAEQVQAMTDLQTEQMDGETSNGVWPEMVVNPEVYGPQGFGNWSDAPYMSGHTQIVQSNPSAEQGWGVGPARRWAHYPITDNPNAKRNANVHLRNGALPWVVEDSYLYERAGIEWELQFRPYKQRNPVNPVIPVATSVPFVQTVPSYGGGDVPIPGVDQPIDPVYVDAGTGVY
jgi:hypothetical protein